MIRFLDVLFSAVGLLLLWPVFLVICFWIKCDSKGPVFYRQTRVGWKGKDFRIFKFRTMYVDADREGLLTVGSGDRRVTKAGRFLRHYKLDELPQLLNVLSGEMSLVGPRPEVRKYVELYDAQQRLILNIRPGITDLASICYRRENDLLAASSNPEETYVQLIMPDKIRLNMAYIQNPTVRAYLHITMRTLTHLFSR